MKIVEYFKRGEHVLCEQTTAKNTHLPGDRIVIYRTRNPETMKNFRESKGI